MKRPKKVMVFGTFDGIHDGHRHFLREAKKQGEELIVAVSKDEVVQKLKNRKPARKITERIYDLKKEGLADLIIEGDDEIHTWRAVEKIKPDIICLGYDQKELEIALRSELLRFSFDVVIKTIDSHRGNELHSSLLNKN
ncbi:MAG: hypothetical protein A3H57_03390 [Candidatus Taylorbacteria bacterium RIFCSPLOWO2_02_FULL_43_11]|uniref:Cytidyltransferase-like domain-containing protein n=1 Tax=Candidatus Taylorbacteria bacterium RIFCSPHIGHO2_02_FULL_43_32b TaxID=1802306 RepID=A0A1G2MEK8_9BACT|nr:MAG: hypothetical protein A2743_02505 [Candidatus Taylorbacteria bacterium RIFCSPHIGHO2_01_FULL_43_47]OHA22263.1 MAG: hypothetical protein A3C72_04180 [Candidatus Taylorbacteria bacterium RIFCSPHIGHO2_02_FULL_43_32b]OHA29602.1 MAG: hypothetical protein A3B08_03215 [Candidatus Taylorbacteria bacterium RIFCSPLOWO2_01_FULL_43_44]OHA36147.1 MAG: hypothetical protein A3H57_03390 [Candidatus Taylorbacteria bacterium RIFCSPLOWO2_02_FULL_43_11]